MSTEKGVNRMKKVLIFTGWTVILLTMVIFFLSERNTSTERKEMKVVVATPEGARQATISGEDESDLDDNFRRAFRIPSKDEEAKVMTRLSKKEVLRQATKGTVYIKRWNVPAYYDPECRSWNGIAYDGGIFPVIARLPQGVIKAVMKSRKGGDFTVIYFAAEDVTTNPKDTDWYRDAGSYDVKPEVPELCPSSSK